MLNYRYINFKFDVNAVNNALNNNNPIYCRGCSPDERTKIKEILNFPLPIKSILYFILQPGSISLIHKDIDLDYPSIKPGFALNLPLENCEMTYMKWYEALDENNVQEFGGPSTSARTPMIKPENSRCIDESNYTYPQIVNVDDWHSVENRSTVKSTLISVRFEKIIQLDYLNQFFMS